MYTICNHSNWYVFREKEQTQAIFSAKIFLCIWTKRPKGLLQAEKEGEDDRGVNRTEKSKQIGCLSVNWLTADTEITSAATSLVQTSPAAAWGTHTHRWLSQIAHGRSTFTWLVQSLCCSQCFCFSPVHSTMFSDSLSNVVIKMGSTYFLMNCQTVRYIDQNAACVNLSVQNTIRNFSELLFVHPQILTSKT